MPPPRRSTRALFALFATLLATALGLAVVVGYFALRAYRDPFPKIAMRLEGDWIIAPDDKIGFVPKPGGATFREHLDTGIRYWIYTDQRGARVDRPGEETPAHVDILTVGGSFSHGHGVENQETFTRRLGNAFAVPVANLAFGSFGTVQSAILLERNLDLEPKIVIYGFIEDHLRRNLAPCAPSYAPYCLPVAFIDFDGVGRPFLHPPMMEYFSPRQNRAFFYQVLMQDGFGWRDVLWRMKIDLFRIRETSRISYRSDSPSKTKALEFLLSKMVAAVEDIGGRLIVMYIPGSRRPVRSAPPELLQAISGHDVEYLDLAPLMSDHYTEPRAAKLFLDDGHPTVSGHELMADALGNLIRGRHLLAGAGEPAAR